MTARLTDVLCSCGTPPVFPGGVAAVNAWADEITGGRRPDEAGTEALDRAGIGRDYFQRLEASRMCLECMRAYTWGIRKNQATCWLPMYARRLEWDAMRGNVSGAAAVARAVQRTPKRRDPQDQDYDQPTLF
jgi:hypothetical protein